MDEISKYHELAKDAGNKLRAYVLSVSSGATGVFFFTLINAKKSSMSCSDKWLLSIALVSYVTTVALCLYELRIDAKRFFALAKELQKPEHERQWETNENYKSQRNWLMHLSYVTLSIAVVSTSVFLVLKIAGT